jgi:hypothetical protein
METIPKHCIDNFINNFNSYPSIIEFNSQKSKELVDKFLSKSELVWVNETIGDGENIVKEKFVLYDSSGIMIYIKEGVTLFILTTIDRYEVAKYSIGMLKRLK